jgi:hypothetical protein
MSSDDCARSRSVCAIRATVRTAITPTTKREHSEQEARKNQRDGNEPGKDGHQEQPQ